MLNPQNRGVITYVLIFVCFSVLILYQPSSTNNQVQDNPTLRARHSNLDLYNQIEVEVIPPNYEDEIKNLRERVGQMQTVLQSKDREILELRGALQGAQVEKQEEISRVRNQYKNPEILRQVDWDKNVKEKADAFQFAGHLFGWDTPLIPTETARSVQKKFTSLPTNYLQFDDKKVLDLWSNYLIKYVEERSDKAPWDYSGWYGDIDHFIIYSMIRHFKPRKIVNLVPPGTTHSLFTTSRAVKENVKKGYPCDHAVVDAYNTLGGRGDQYEVTLIHKNIFNVEPALVELLGENDLLILNTPHSIAPYSSSIYQFTDTLFRLKKGVIVKFHDIFLPGKWMFDEYRAFTDQWLLATFLHGNSNWEILFPVAKMVNDYPEKFAEKGLSSNFYNSDFWIRKIR